jgi:putative membrane protein
MRRSDFIPLGLMGALAVVFARSAWQPYDRLTWWLEIAPGLVALAILILIYRRFRFTDFAYVLIALHISILCVGGHYTYVRVPWFDLWRETFHFSRNHFDRLGHLAQGFVPAIVGREILLRNGVVNGRGWLAFLIVCVCLAISAFYELIEWWTALASGAASSDFIGSQGDAWDTQADMFCALIGAIFALLFCSRFHDRALRRAGCASAPEHRG